MASPGQMTRRVVLTKPPAKTADTFGEPVSDASPTRFPVWCSWKEAGGNETVVSDTEVGITVVTADIWWHVQIRDLDVHWGLIGENNCDYDILSVEELGGRRWQFRLKAVLRA